MSESDAGSDLASVGTRGRRVDGGWRIEGTKVWTSGAHRSDAFVVLARTESLDESNRHAGLTQFIIDLQLPGVEISPIMSASGDAHFNEVHLQNVFVPDEQVLGQVGSGWEQVTSELGFERSGPERFLSTYPLLREFIEEAGCGSVVPSPAIGRFVARLSALHHVSMAVAAALERRQRVDSVAATVKLAGTTLEGDIADLADRHGALTTSGRVRELAEASLLARPGFALRGGTNEILRGIVARSLEERS